MNILYLLFSFTTGGTERLVCDICNEMVKRDHRVHLYVVNDLFDQSMLDALDPLVQVQLQKRAAGSGGKLQTLKKIADYIRKKQIQVIHCNSLDAPELLLLKPLFAPKAKVLYTVHGMHQMKQKSRSGILLRNLLCHKIIAISQCVKEDILAAGIRESLVVTVPNAIDLSKFPEPSSKALDLAAPIIGNVARIQPQVKGQDILIRAITLLKDTYPRIRCIFAGEPAKDRPQALTDLQDLAAQLDLTDNICFLGNVEDVPSFLAQIDIFVLPSRSEGFGISLVEAMAMEIPCISSNLEGPSEVLENGKFGVLFEPENPQDLAEHLRKMLCDYPEHKQVALTARQHIRTKYNIAAMCDRLETLFK